MLDISIRQLEVLVATVEFCSFTRAAEELHLTQSTISMHIRALEELLGVRLIERGAHRRVTLTEDGKRVYLAAKDILEQVQKLQSLQEEGERDVLKIGTSTVPAQYLLPKLLSGFTKKHPNARYILRRGDSDHILESLKKGEVRIAFTGRKEGDSSLHFQQIAEDKLVLVTNTSSLYSNLAAQGVAANDLLTLPMIARTEGSGTQHAAQAFLQQLNANPPIIARMENPETIKMSVMEGMGCAILSNLAVADEVQAGKMLSFSFTGIDDSRKLYVAWQKDAVLQPLEQKLIQYVRTRTSDILLSK